MTKRVPESTPLLAAAFVLGRESEPEIELPPVIEASDHLVLRGYEDACEGTFAEMEVRVLTVQALFQAPAIRVTYNWMEEEFPSAGCGPGALACAPGHDIFARDWRSSAN